MERVEKSCENCNKECLATIPDCTKDYDQWKPDYQTLESQLSTANELIKEQIEQLAECREALDKIASSPVYKEDGQLIGYSLMGEPLQNIAKEALTKAKGG